ncbi:hypothetical protein [Halobaculum limi]|uniref:hypothetical protein n=1 Tax=Halobaculum limi TaxID=3031916 RepID=UPI0024058990|nr:hypothetical protein [Halobaculum sp. YSMS11]
MDTRSRVHLVIALLLVAAPLWGPPLDLTGPDYEYRTVDLAAEDGNLTVDHDDLAAEDRPIDYFEAPSDQIACFSRWATVDHDRGCYLDSRLRGGDVAVDYPPIGGFNGMPTTDDAPYVAFGLHSPVYERTLTYDDANETFVFGLDRVDARTALADVADDPEYAPPVIQRALDDGSARRDEAIAWFDENRIYRHDGGYVLVYEEPIYDGYSEKPGVERGFETLSVLVGAVLLFRVGRDSVRES